jgi:hypothetical protein
VQDPFEMVCEKLTTTTGYEPRGTEHQRKGLCPAHADDKPSLTIRNDLVSGLVGVTCFAGCDFGQISSALGLRAVDFRSSSNGNGRRTASPATNGSKRPTKLGKELERYCYTDEAGNPLYYNVRYEPKDFRMAGPDGAVKQLSSGIARVPYNLPKLLDAIRRGQTVYWVEGEKDVKSLEAVGVVATTAAGGVNAPILPGWARYFVGADLVVIADRDDAGRTYAKSIGKLMINTAESVRIAESATPQAKSDVTDHLAAGYKLEQLKFQATRSLRRVRWSVRQILETKPEPLRWVLPGVIPEGLTLLVGAPKTGKSWWNLNLMVALATGRPEEVFAWGQRMDPSPSLYAALEDPQRRVHTRLHKVIRGLDFNPDAAGDVWLDLPPIAEGGREEIERWIEDHPTARAIMVDVLAKVRGTAKEGTSGLYQADYDSIGNLKDIADQYGIGVIVTHHDRKKTDEDFLNMVSGTKGVTGAADTILFLKRERGSNQGTLQCESRDVEECTYELEFVRETGRWHIMDRLEPGSDTAQPGMSLGDQIAQAILARGDSSDQDLADIVQVDIKTVRRVCLAERESGHLGQDAAGRWFVPKVV